LPHVTRGQVEAAMDFANSQGEPMGTAEKIGWTALVGAAIVCMVIFMILWS